MVGARDAAVWKYARACSTLPLRISKTPEIKIICISNIITTLQLVYVVNLEIKHWFPFYTDLQIDFIPFRYPVMSIPLFVGSSI